MNSTHSADALPSASLDATTLTADAAFQALCDSLLTDARASGSAATAESQAGRVFERVVAPVYLLLSLDYKNEETRVTQFTDWARRNPDWSETSSDQGIDLILQTPAHEKPSPIQVKFLTGDASTQSPLPRERLDALTAQTRVPGRIDRFARPVILTNARAFTSAARDLIAAQGLVAHGYDWFVDVNAAMIAGGITPPTTVAELLAIETQVLSSGSGSLEVAHVPLEHQVDAVAHVQRVLESSDRTTVHFACGTGKTLVAWMLFNERVSAGETGVIFVPALSLVKDAIATFIRQSTDDKPYDILAVCSDVTVLPGSDRTSSEMDICAADLNASAITSDASVIAAWLSKPSTDRRLLVATYQSSILVKEAVKAFPHTFSLLIGDEAHRLVGERGVFGAPVWGVTAKRSVFMTATPKVTVGGMNTATGDIRVASMSDASKFGAEDSWFTYTTSQGVEAGILAPYHISVYVTQEGDELTDVANAMTTAINISDQVIDGVSTQRRNITARMVVIANQCAKTMRETRGGKGMSLVFFATKKESNDFVAYMHETYPDVPAMHVDGEMNTDARKGIRLQITASGGVLSNARVLNEGVDIPALNTVIFGTPKSSKVDIVQGVGRVLRRDPNNPDKVGQIVIPVVLPANVDDADIDGLIENTAFAPLWSTLRALADNDDSLLRMLVVMKNPSLAGTPDGAGGTYPSLEAARAGCDSLFRVDFAGQRLNDALAAGDEGLLERFTDSITTRMLRSMDGNWMTTYAAVREYVIENSRTPFQTDIDYTARRLGNWCNTQRHKKNNDALSKEHIAILESIPGWFWSKVREEGLMTWNETFDEVKAYMSEHGRKPQMNDSDPVVKRLGRWCINQGAAKRAGTLSNARVEMFGKIPGWVWGQHLDAAWKVTFDEVKAYMSEHGRKPSGRDRDYSVKRLGNWCGNVRRAYIRGSLGAERTTLIESLPGWTWDQHLDAVWKATFDEVKAYMSEYGRKPQMNDSDPVVKRLGVWCYRQRSMKFAGTISPERTTLIESLPGWIWDQNLDAAWNATFDEVKAYISKHGRKPQINDSDPVVKRLGVWYNNVRQAYIHGTISPERTILIESLPGWNQDKDAAWKATFDEVKAYMSEHGRKPSGRDRDYSVKRLGTWCSNVRRSHIGGSLGAERTTLIESLPGWSWDQNLDAAWNATFDEVKAYMSEYGIAPSSKGSDPTEKRLGGWCKKRRSEKRAGSLSPERIALLESIPSWWWEKA